MISSSSFGNAFYQDVADRFVVALEEVPFHELSQIWRNTIGGGVLWDAPVYEQFFRNLRRANESLPPAQRVRVLLGDPDIHFAKIRSAADVKELGSIDRDRFFASVVEREVWPTVGMPCSSRELTTFDAASTPYRAGQ